MNSRSGAHTSKPKPAYNAPALAGPEGGRNKEHPARGLARNSQWDSQVQIRRSTREHALLVASSQHIYLAYLRYSLARYTAASGPLTGIMHMPPLKITPPPQLIYMRVVWRCQALFLKGTSPWFPGGLRCSASLPSADGPWDERS